MPLRGTIETMSVGDLLDWLDRRTASGILTLTRGGVVRRFQLDAGTITVASSSEPRALLGRLLVERGLLAPEQLDRALRAGRETGTHLGRVLASVGLVTEGDLRALLAAKVEALLTDTLAWTDGRFVFEDGAPARIRRTRSLQISIKLRDALRVARGRPARHALHS